MLINMISEKVDINGVPLHLPHTFLLIHLFCLLFPFGRSPSGRGFPLIVLALSCPKISLQVNI